MITSAKTAAGDGHFVLSAACRVVVPINYDSNYPKLFRARHGSIFTHLNDESFNREIDPLIPGTVHWAKLVTIKGLITAQECLEFLRTKEAILIGGPGLLLAWECGHSHEGFFPFGKWIFSFDRDAARQPLIDNRQLPCLGRFPNVGWQLASGQAKDLNSKHCFLCFSSASPAVETEPIERGAT